MAMDCIGSGVVFENPQPQLRSVHAWHPSIVAFDDGELFASFDLGQAVESFDYVTYVTRSRDGQNWDAPRRMFEVEHAFPTTHSIRVTRVPDGRLIGFGGRFHRRDPNAGLVNPANLGYVPMDLIQLESSDRGRTWRGPTNVEPPLVGPAFETCHPVRELRDGRWLLPTSTWRGWNGDAPNGMQAVALVSHDKGQTWPEYISVMDGRRDQVIYWEQSVVELLDGGLLVVAWALHEPSGKSLPSVFALSRDGRTFTPPAPNGLLGQTAKLLCLRDGRILCLYRRVDKPGLWAALAVIDGDAWVTLEQIPVWEGATAGIEGKRPTSVELSALKFGYPSMAQLPSGEVFAVFWCSEDCLGKIRWARLQVN